MSEQEIYWSREWLNGKGHHSTAFVFSYINTWSNRRNLSGELVIGDCSRQVSLDLDVFSGENQQKEYANTIEKLDRLIKTLAETRSAIVEHMESS